MNYTNYGKGQTITRPAADDGGLLAEPVGGAGGAELTEQREQSQTTFELCRVATEVGESQGRLDAEGAGRPRDDDDRFERSR